MGNARPIGVRSHRRELDVHRGATVRPVRAFAASGDAPGRRAPMGGPGRYTEPVGDPRHSVPDARSGAARHVHARVRDGVRRRRRRAARDRFGGRSAAHRSQRQLRARCLRDTRARALWKRGARHDAGTGDRGVSEARESIDVGRSSRPRLRGHDGARLSAVRLVAHVHGRRVHRSQHVEARRQVHSVHRADGDRRVRRLLRHRRGRSRRAPASRAVASGADARGVPCAHHVDWVSRGRATRGRPARVAPVGLVGTGVPSRACPRPLRDRRPRVSFLGRALSGPRDRDRRHQRDGGTGALQAGARQDGRDFRRSTCELSVESSPPIEPADELA